MIVTTSPRLTSNLPYPRRWPATSGGPPRTDPCAMPDTADGTRPQNPRVACRVPNSGPAVSRPLGVPGDAFEHAGRRLLVMPWLLPQLLHVTIPKMHVTCNIRRRRFVQN